MSKLKKQMAVFKDFNDKWTLFIEDIILIYRKIYPPWWA
jgi:hypothetical protein